jgi:hypothetical protein
VFPIDGLGLDPDDAMVLAAAQLVLAFLSDPETNPKATTTIERELEQKAGEGCRRMARPWARIVHQALQRRRATWIGRFPFLSSSGNPGPSQGSVIRSVFSSPSTCSPAGPLSLALQRRRGMVIHTPPSVKKVK